jgi:transcription antitermination factor NusG
MDEIMSDWQEINKRAIEQAQTSDMRRTYYVLRVDSQRIGKVIEHLPKIGVLAFAPMEERTARSGSGGRKSARIQLRPIMSGYVVAGLTPNSPSWFGIFSQPHIYGVISRDGRPAIIPQHSLARCFKIHHATGTSLPGAKSLKPGDQIRITSGGWQGHETRLLDIKGEQCEFVVDLFGKEHRVRQSIHNVEAA